MDCRTFENLLADFQEGRLTPAECGLAEKHLANCLSCHCLLEIASGNLDLMPAERGQELTRSILARTSGDACRRAQELLCDFVDDVLKGEDAGLVSQHVENCAGCSALVASLLELIEILPQMAEIRPDERFLESVMQATVGQRQPLRPSLRTRVLEGWNRMVQRPRFSFEAAYVGTLVVAIFFGNPFPTMRALSVHALDAFSEISPGSVEKHDPWALRSARSFVVSLSTREQGIRASLEETRRQGESMVSASMDYQIRTLRTYWSKGSGAARRFWQHLWSGSSKHPSESKRS